MSVETELGTLVVVVLKARNLIDKHSFYKQDVFAQLVLDRTTYRTPVEVKGGQHPVWDAEIRIPVLKDAKDKSRTLQVSCWAREPRGEDLLGEGKVDISETLKTGEFDDWVPLMINGTFRGDVYMEMTFFAHHRPQSSPGGPATATLGKRPSKLSPSDRLWRPSSLTPPRTSPSSSPSHSPGPSRLQQSTVNTPLAAPSPPHSRISPSPSRKPQETLLPPLPPRAHVEIPQTLIPGARRQTQKSPSSSPSPQRQDLSFGPVSPESSRVYDAVLHQLNVAPPHRPTPSVPPPPPLHPSTLSPSFPPTYSQSVTPANGVPGSFYSPNIVAQTPDPYHVPGAFPGVSFPVPQRAPTSFYGYSNPQVSAPSAPLPYPGGRESELPNPYSQNVYAAPPLAPPGPPPRGRQPLDPRLSFQSGFPAGQGGSYYGQAPNRT